MTAPRIYLAGPDVFLPEPMKMAEKLKYLCQKHGLQGVFPLDTALDLDDLTPHQKAEKIFKANCLLIQSCVGVLANMTPFRGPSADVGTAWEMGYAYGLGKPVMGYTYSPSVYSERVEIYRNSITLMPTFDDPEFVESFDLTDNLMLDCSAHTVLPSFEEAVVAMEVFLRTPKT